MKQSKIDKIKKKGGEIFISSLNFFFASGHIHTYKDTQKTPFGRANFVFTSNRTSHAVVGKIQSNASAP